MSERSEKLTFTGAKGDKLDARLELPQGAPKAYALFAHCFTCSKASRAATLISRALTAHGYGVLRFDFTGLGGSEGEFANTNFSSNVEDLVSASEYLESEYDAPGLLIGHSLGGAAVIQAAPDIESAQAIAVIGSPGDPEHVKHIFKQHVEDIEEDGEAEVEIGGRAFTITRQFLEDIEQHKIEANLKDLRKALLICHAPRDEIVGIDNATDIFVAAKHPKSFISLDSADHLLSDERDARYAADVIAAWASRYVGLQRDAAPKTTHDVPKGVTRVSSVTGEKFLHEVVAGGHAMLADEPTDYGGTDKGPSPYDLLLAGLGACTGMTMRMYAERKDWPLESVTVDLTHEKIHAEDCADCETKEGKVDVIERIIEIKGDLDDDQRSRLMEIADKCPVHRTLHSEIRIETKKAG